MQNDIRPPSAGPGKPGNERKPNPDSQPSEPKDPKPNEKPMTDDKTSNKSTKRRLRLMAWIKMLNKKQRIIALVLFGVLLIGTTAMAMPLFIKDPPPPTPVIIVKKEKPEPEPTTVASRLTGVQIDPKLNKLPVTGIMVENSPEARPQAGLASAGIVFEALVEGGISRFLALYMEDQPGNIGPVRSARRHYLDIIVPFDAAIAHAGGSGTALSQIRNQKIKDIDHGANAGAFQRISSRFAPHNLFTSRAKLLQVHKSRGYMESKFTSLARKEKEEPLKTAKASSIDFRISRSQLYNPHFDYDKKSNVYKRSQGGRPHTDKDSGKQITSKVVIAIETSYRKSGIYSIYGMSGKGTVTIFQDGDVIKGTWSKKNRSGQYSFTDAKGDPIKLTPGRTWITLVTAGDVSYKP